MLEARGYTCVSFILFLSHSFTHKRRVSPLLTTVGKPHSVMFSWQVQTLCFDVGARCWQKQGTVGGESQEAQMWIQGIHPKTRAPGPGTATDVSCWPKLQPTAYASCCKAQTSLY